MPLWNSSRSQREGGKKGRIIFPLLILLSFACKGSEKNVWPPLHKILLVKKYSPRITQGKTTIPGKQKKLILRWITSDKTFIDSLTLTRYKIKPGDFRITRIVKNNSNLVVRLYAPFLKEHKIYAGIQLILVFNEKTLNPRVAYLTPVPWEK